MEDAHIKEAYVPFKTAKLLREKGFNEELCHMWYNIRKDVGYYLSSVGVKNHLPAPTVQMAVEYIEKKGYCIIATPYTTPEKLLWCCEVKELRVIGDFCTLVHVYCKPAMASRVEALNEGVEHVLENLI